MSLLALIAAKTAPVYIKPKALYIIPHQDDEFLTAGGAITDDVQRGYDVYAIIATDGKADGTRSDGRTSGVIGYTPSPEAFSAQRDKEFAEGIRRMGGTPILSPFEKRQPDGGSTPTGIAALVREYGVEGAALRATSNYDYHADHRNCGWALIQLWKEGYGTDPRLMISEYKKSLMPARATPQTMGHPDSLTEYHAWPYYTQAPPEWWGIGALSVPAWFDFTLNTNATTHWHTPID